jgi:D-3-phosphoglycerate dehydrogenase
LLFSRNADVPGVVGHFGTVLGKHKINIAHFSLGRQDVPSKPGAALVAIVVVATDTAVPEAVIRQILENKDILTARMVEFKS